MLRLIILPFPAAVAPEVIGGVLADGVFNKLHHFFSNGAIWQGVGVGGKQNEFRLVVAALYRPKVAHYHGGLV